MVRTGMNSDRLRTWGCLATALSPVLASLPASANNRHRLLLPMAETSHAAESCCKENRRLTHLGELWEAGQVVCLENIPIPVDIWEVACNFTIAGVHMFKCVSELWWT